MPSSTQVLLWRKQAADKIHQVLTGLEESDFKTSDYKADELLRSLNNLPKRPADRAPYQGVFPNIGVAEGRQKVADLLKQRIVGISGDALQPLDNLVDDALRVMLEKGDRQTNEPPYSGIFPETPLPKISVDQLLQIAPYADPGQVNKLYPHLLLTMLEYGVDSPLRQAHFIAQVAHESGSFNYLEELASGEDYEGRDDLGNTEPGDGVRFKGRGLIQITGRNNYRDCGTDLGVDLINHPPRLADSDLACLSAGWFWSTNDLNSLADNDDVEGVTLRINGGYNGLDERKDFLAAAKQVLGL